MLAVSEGTCPENDAVQEILASLQARENLDIIEEWEKVNGTGWHDQYSQLVAMVKHLTHSFEDLEITMTEVSALFSHRAYELCTLQDEGALDLGDCELTTRNLLQLEVQRRENEEG